MGVAAVEASAAVRQHREIRPLLGSGHDLAKDPPDHLGNASVTGKLQALDLSPEHPEAPLEQRLQIANLGQAFVPQLLVKLFDQLETALHLIERDLCSAHSPVGEELVQFIKVARFHGVKLLDQPVLRVRQFKLCQDARDLLDLVDRYAGTGVHNRIEEVIPAVPTSRR